MYRARSYLILISLVLLPLLVYSASPPWKQYPYVLVPSNPNQFTFPATEGGHDSCCQSDSWFVTGLLKTTTSNKSYQFVTIFDRNKLAPAVHFHFYQASIFDLQTKEYHTFTEYDMEPLVTKLTYSTSKLDLSFRSVAGTSFWRNAYNSDKSIIPFQYQVYLPGIDQITNKSFSIQLNIDAQKEPVAYGLDVLKGYVIFYAQNKTLSYFQTGLHMSGTVTINGVAEQVEGSIGHIDRQWFPLYSGIDTPDGREHSHEWRQINLENGMDLAIWRQFDRKHNNTVIQTTGTTTDPPDTATGRSTTARYVDGDVEVEYISYAKYPRDIFQTLVPPPSKNMWLPSSHIIRVSSLQLQLKCDYYSPVPAIKLPVEYFEGPATWVGTIGGVDVSGTGIFESTLGLWRDYELAEVLINSVSHLPDMSFAPGSKDKVVAVVNGINQYVSSDPKKEDKAKAKTYIISSIGPILTTSVINADDQKHVLLILTDLDQSL